AVSHADVGNGQYDITISSTGYGLGDHWFRFKATKAGEYLEDAIVNVTFTVRKHYTTVSVVGDLTTPSGDTTDLTVVIIDTDTGATLSSTTSVTSWNFDSATETDQNENSPADFDVTLTTDTWGLGTESVTLSVVMSGNYENPDDYSFDIVIRKHYTSVAVIGDLVTPYGETTDITIVITDLDTGTILGATTYVTSWNFDAATQTDDSEGSPADFAFTITTDDWALGTETVTLSVVMSGIYENPSDYDFDIEIRRHYTSVTVIGDLVTPSGDTTDVTVVITDTDTGSILSVTTDVTSWFFNAATQSDDSEASPADFAFTITTDDWAIGTETVTLSVVMSGIYENPTNYQFDVEIRKHYTSVIVTGGLITPSGQTTDVTVQITDLDTNTVLASTGSVTSWFFNAATQSDDSEGSPADFAFTITTDDWALGTETVTLSVVMSGIYENPANHVFDIEIRKHYTSVTVIGNLVTPYGGTTDVTVVITDTDTGSILGATTFVTSWNFNAATQTDDSEASPADFAFTLTTDDWSVGTESVTLSVV
ncbi:MAG: hypothetical protein ACXAEF_05695, partial [Candidatus Thorarchaeota archaeon]